MIHSFGSQVGMSSVLIASVAGDDARMAAVLVLESGVRDMFMGYVRELK